MAFRIPGCPRLYTGGLIASPEPLAVFSFHWRHPCQSNVERLAHSDIRDFKKRQEKIQSRSLQKDTNRLGFNSHDALYFTLYNTLYNAGNHMISCIIQCIIRCKIQGISYFGNKSCVRTNKCWNWFFLQCKLNLFQTGLERLSSCDRHKFTTFYLSLNIDAFAIC